MEENGHWMKVKIGEDMSVRFSDVMNLATGEVQVRDALHTQGKVNHA